MYVRFSFFFSPLFLLFLLFWEERKRTLKEKKKHSIHCNDALHMHLYMREQVSEEAAK